MAASAVGGALWLALSLLQEPSPASSVPLTSPASSRSDALLATVPDKLEIAGDSVARSNFGARAARSSIAWSADGKRVAYAARRGDDWLPVVGAEVGESFVYVSRPSLAGEHVFFHVARNLSASKQQNWLWVDGKRIGPEDWMGDVSVRADGQAVAYWTQPGARFGDNSSTGNPKHVLVVASETGAQWSLARGGDHWFDCSNVPPLFSADGKHVITCALERGKGWRVVQAGKKEALLTEPCPAIESFAVSASGAALAFVRANAPQATSVYPRPADDAQLYFKGKRLARGREMVAMPAVDARGNHVAYVVKRGDARTVAIDEQEPAGVYDYVLDLTFDPRGEKLAFAANTGGVESQETPGQVAGGEWFVIVRPVEAGGEPLELAHCLEVRDLCWDGKRLAYAAREEGGWRMVCGDLRSDVHSDVGPPNFAADGRSLGFGSRDGRQLWWRVLALP